MTTIISCPSCGAAYDIPEIGGIRGRKVRCQTCATVWRVEQPGPAADVSTAASQISSSAQLHEEIGKAEAPAGPRGLSREDVPRTIALSAGPGGRVDNGRAGEGPVVERRRPGRRASGFDEVEAAIAALQSSIGKQPDPLEPPAQDSDEGGSEDDLPAMVRERAAIAARQGLARRSAGSSDGFRPLSASRSADDDPFAPNRDFEAELRGSRVAATVSWAVFACLVSGLAWLAWANGAAIVRGLPGSAALYAMLGQHVNVRGFEFSSVDAQWQTDRQGRAVLSLTGQVQNVTKQPLSVPTVVVAFLDDEGRELFDWATPMPASALPPGEIAPFTTVVPAPPNAVRGVEIRFAKAHR